MILITPFLFFFRRSTDIRLERDRLIIRYPFKKEEVNLPEELECWVLQEANMMRLGKVYAINLRLKSGKWRTVSSRFNAEVFAELFKYLEAGYGDRREADNR